MKAAFAAMGGHGTSYSEVRDMSTRDYVSGRVCTVRDGSQLFDYPGGLAIGTIDPLLDRDFLGTDRSDDYALIGSELDGKPRTAWVRKKAVSDIRDAPATAPDCTAAVAAGSDGPANLQSLCTQHHRVSNRRCWHGFSGTLFQAAPASSRRSGSVRRGG